MLRKPLTNVDLTRHDWRKSIGAVITNNVTHGYRMDKLTSVLSVKGRRNSDQYNLNIDMICSLFGTKGLHHD